MANLVTGSCNCGRHSYTIPKATEMNLCRCMDCRKWAGAVHPVPFFVKISDIQTKSLEPKSMAIKTESENEMEREFGLS